MKTAGFCQQILPASLALQLFCSGLLSLLMHLSVHTLFALIISLIFDHNVLSSSSLVSSDNLFHQFLKFVFQDESSLEIAVRLIS